MAVSIFESNPQPCGNGTAALLLRAGRHWPAVLVVSTIIALVISPLTCNTNDMWICWVPWARATAGYKPWMAYTVPNCNYPPFMLYVLTVVEAIERLARLHQGARALFIQTLIKLPSVLAYAAGAVLCARGLRRVMGTAAANAVALAYVLCLPVWHNAAIWGQCDALLSLAMVTAIIALLNDRPFTAGGCVGWALSIKLQSFVIIPAFVVYAFGRFGWLTVIRAAATGIAVLSLLMLPMMFAGYGHQLRVCYTGAVGYYPYLSINTFNPWSLVTVFNVHVRHLPRTIAAMDSVHWLGSLTPKRIGMLMFLGFTGWLMLQLYRRPTKFSMVLTAGLTAYGFYMLPTEMHERYVIPATALLSLLVVSGGGRIYLAVMIPGLLNQLKASVGQIPVLRDVPGETMSNALDVVTVIVASTNVLLLFWISRESCREIKAGREFITNG